MHLVFIQSADIDIFCKLMYNLFQSIPENGRRLFPPYAISLSIVHESAGEISKQRRSIVMELTYLVLTIVLVVALTELIKHIKK